jgi:hypothetical protein
VLDRASVQEPLSAAASATSHVGLVAPLHLESMGLRRGSSLHPLWSAGAALRQSLLDLLDTIADGGHSCAPFERS